MHPALRLAHLHHADNETCWRRERAKHADYKALGSPASERRVTRETKDYFDALARIGKVCNYAQLASTAAPAGSDRGHGHGLRVVHKDAGGDRAHPVEIIDGRWRESQV